VLGDKIDTTHRCAGLGKGAGNGAPDAIAGARDDRGSPGKKKRRSHC
jgi:hypothetical protein